MKRHSKKFICEAIVYWKKQLKKLDESSSSLSAVVSTTPAMVNAFGEYLTDEYDASDSNSIDFCLGLEWENFKKRMQVWANENEDDPDDGITTTTYDENNDNLDDPWYDEDYECDQV